MELTRNDALALLRRHVKNEKMIQHCLASEAVMRGIAIRMHNECSSGKERSTEFQFALAAGETITGLRFATTYVYPDRILGA